VGENARDRVKLEEMSGSGKIITASPLLSREIGSLKPSQDIIKFGNERRIKYGENLE
jgi:hypothetical protein